MGVNDSEYEVVICSYRMLFFKQKTAYEMRISDWSSYVCSSDLLMIGEETATWPAGWTVLGTAELASGTYGWIYRVVDGSEGFTGSGDKIGRATCRVRVCQYV